MKCGRRSARSKAAYSVSSTAGYTRVVGRLIQFDPARSWEDSVNDNANGSSAPGQNLQWDLLRLRLFLDRWRQGRFVDFGQRERSAAHYHARFGTEFGIDVLLTCQGAPSLMRWRGRPLMKNVFDFAIYPALIAELRPRTVLEVGSGLGASAAWFADHLALCGVDGRVHSVDLVKPEANHPSVDFHQGDCADPERLFAADLLRSAPHPWLVVEDAHHNVAAVLERFHAFLSGGDYLVVEDSDVKRVEGLSRRPSRRLSGGHAIHRLLRPQRDLRCRFDIRQNAAAKPITRGMLRSLTATIVRSLSARRR
jgi:cephalosporin hydroxylase